MAAGACSGVRFAQPTLFQAFLLLSACLLLHRSPINGGSSFGLVLVAANALEAAEDTPIGEELDREGRGGTAKNVGFLRTGHLADEKNSRLLVSPLDEMAPPQGGAATVFARAATSSVLAVAGSEPSEHVSGGVVAQYPRRGVEGETPVETGAQPRRLRVPRQPSRKLDSNSNDIGNNGHNNNNNNNNNSDDKEPRGEQHQAASAKGGSSVVAEGGGGGDGGAGDGAGMVKFRLGGRVETFMAGNVMQEYLNQLVAESVAATENQVCCVQYVLLRFAACISEKREKISDICTEQHHEGSSRRCPLTVTFLIVFFTLRELLRPPFLFRFSNTLSHGFFVLRVYEISVLSWGEPKISTFWLSDFQQAAKEAPRKHEADYACCMCVN